ncbi:hypothetical protein MMC20_007610 [Loxospora ochrophaea]|nr:hypothetical protein [Loxospora ochrophaea]
MSNYHAHSYTSSRSSINDDYYKKPTDPKVPYYSELKKSSNPKRPSDKKPLISQGGRNTSEPRRTQDMDGGRYR